jgi:PD-(D/E)XK endonuclease
MIFLVGDRLVRIQCKWAPLSGDTVVVRCYSSRRAREGLRRRIYTAEEIDAFAAYCPDLNRCYFLPIRAFPDRTHIFLRLSPTRDKQRSLVNWAEDFEFAATLGRHQGAIAQLGERQRGTLEVAGSSPAGSTR